MHKTYRSAAKIIIFTGPKYLGDDEGLDLAVKFFNLFNSSWECAQDISKEKANAFAMKLLVKGDSS